MVAANPGRGSSYLRPRGKWQPRFRQCQWRQLLRCGTWRRAPECRGTIGTGR